MADDAPRVIAAQYVGWRLIRGQKMLRLEFEVPMERQNEVLTILGAPLADLDQWVGIARLDLGAAETPDHVVHKAHPTVLEAVLLCKDPRFQKYITWKTGGKGTPFSEETAISALYRLCDIPSRRILGEDSVVAHEARRRFAVFVADYKEYFGI